MQILADPAELQELGSRWRNEGRRVALVVTQGNLHAGQRSLISAARAHASTVVVSIFPNPLEFGPAEHFDRYPRQPDADVEAARSAGADVAFVPTPDSLHPPGRSTIVDEETRSRRLCGISRPQHFRGFLTNFFQLVHLTQPAVTLFGQKDAQQAAVARAALRDLYLPVEVVLCPTVRDPDGFLLSWRTRLLTPTARAEAAIAAVALERATDLVRNGHRNVDRVVAEVTHTLATRRLVRVIYVQCVDRDSMEPAREIVPGSTLLMLAIWVDEVRFIDNATL